MRGLVQQTVSGAALGSVAFASASTAALAPLRFWTLRISILCDYLQGLHSPHQRSPSSHYIPFTHLLGRWPTKRSSNSPVSMFSSMSAFPFPWEFWSIEIPLWKIVWRGISNLRAICGGNRSRLHFLESFLLPVLLARQGSFEDQSTCLRWAWAWLCYFCVVIDLGKVIMSLSLGFLICQMGILVHSWQGYCEV